MASDEKIKLSLLVLLAVVLSTYLYFHSYVISLDGAFQYIPMAKLFESGSVKEATRFCGQQPLYSFLIALVSRWGLDVEVAGRLLSSFFGVLILFPVYFLGKRLFDQKIALLSVFFLVIHPYMRRFSADVLKESTYLFFLALALWYAVRTFEKENVSSYLLIPVLSAIPYLVRPDGVELLFVIFFYVLFLKTFSSPVKRWKVLLTLILCSVVLLLPYLLYLRETTGASTLSKAKSVAGFLGWTTMKSEVSLITRILYSLKKLTLGILTLYHPLYVYFFILGLWQRGARLRKGEGLLLIFCILHCAVLFLLILNLTDWSQGVKKEALVFSERHALPLLVVSIYWVGEGFLTLSHWLSQKLGSCISILRSGPQRRSMIVVVTLFALSLAIVLPKTLKPQRYEKLSEKWAGIWIKNRSVKETTIFTTVPRVAYYAGGKAELIDLQKDRFDQVRASMVERKAAYLVVQETDLARFREAAASIKQNFVEQIRYGEKGMEKIIVYKMSW